ncbi:MAG: UvrD-helicase domain-containing protein [Opitutaceae bacterium]
MILASAGSGKTYALTNRYVALLALGAPPERIVALTFTRKAAGEFFDEILNKLARAASDAGAAARLAEAIGQPALGRAEFLVLLRKVVEAMPRLNLGTLDSFFARIVRSFPLELGLGGDFEILQEHAARRERRRVLRSLFTAAGEPDTAQREFIEAFKRATFGVEEKQLTLRLDSFLDQHAETYLAAPRQELWGNPERIWPSGCTWLDAAEGRDAAVAALRAVLPWETLNERQRARLEAFFAECAEWSPGAPLPPAMTYLLKNLFAVWEDVLAGRGDLILERKKVPLHRGLARALADVAASLLGADLRRRLEMTQGLFRVLRSYERVYDLAVRRSGRLTFADMQRLLQPESGGPRLTSPAGVAVVGEELDRRLLIDWRLDAEFDHWLLDEFQDTSFGQWSVLRNLIDEVVQDPEQRRSFFYVGDVKQAIYAWREGDARLFREIFHHYNHAPGGPIEERQLNQSWRSGPAIIEVVNRVFGDRQALGQVVPTATAEAWKREWTAHTTAHADLQAYACLTHASDEAGRFAETLRILQQTDALNRGLTVAVLVQKNDTGARLADYLRREGGLAAVAESDLHVCVDNPLGTALLALLRAAAHPGDTLAWEYVVMSPLGPALAARGIGTVGAVVTRLLGEVHADGFAITLERWYRAVEPVLDPADAFSRERGRQLIDAAHRFDELGSRDVAEFLDYAERFTVRDADTARVVRVMTVHKSKGLGFDLVILPDLEGSSLGERRRGLAVQKAPDRSVSWILDLPVKLFAERDPVLGAYLEAAGADAAYESLCLLYVAMTRAKRAMYLVTEPVGASVSRNFPSLLQHALGETCAVGNERWYEGCRLPDAGADAGQRSTPVLPGVGRIRLPARTPSGTERVALVGSVVFALESGGGADHGIGVHTLLAGIEWAPQSQAERPIEGAEWADASARVQDEVRKCLMSPSLAEVFARPRDAIRVEVWRERAFEVVLDGVWVTGVFDRVTVERDALGKVTRVKVWDFKTDRVRNPADAEKTAGRYFGQMDLYRRVAARLTGVPATAVDAALVFTSLPVIIGVSPSVDGPSSTAVVGN